MIQCHAEKFVEVRRQPSGVSSLFHFLLAPGCHWFNSQVYRERRHCTNTPFSIISPFLKSSVPLRLFDNFVTSSKFNSQMPLTFCVLPRRLRIIQFNVCDVIYLFCFSRSEKGIDRKEPRFRLPNLTSYVSMQYVLSFICLVVWPVHVSLLQYVLEPV